MGFFFFIIIIIIIVSFSKNTKNQTNQTQINKYLNDAILKPRVTNTPNSVNNEASYQINRKPNSYYSKEKIDKYKKQDMDHSEHLVENVSADVNKIGYNKCPKCGTLNSKKLDKCFMCDAEIK